MRAVAAYLGVVVGSLVAIFFRNVGEVGRATGNEGGKQNGTNPQRPRNERVLLVFESRSKGCYLDAVGVSKRTFRF